jgi:hypothetical protein
MIALRCGLLLAMVLSGAYGCAAGGPFRSSDIQNRNAISDDIDAVRMTRSSSSWTRDPNMRSTIPNNYEVTSTTP